MEFLAKDLDFLKLKQCHNLDRENTINKQSFRFGFRQLLENDSPQNKKIAEGYVRLIHRSIMDGTFCPLASWFIVEKRAFPLLPYCHVYIFYDLFEKAFGLEYNKWHGHNLELFLTGFGDLLEYLRPEPEWYKPEKILNILLSMEKMLEHTDSKKPELFLEILKITLKHVTPHMNNTQNGVLHNICDNACMRCSEILRGNIRIADFSDEISLSLTRKGGILMLYMDRYLNRCYENLNSYLDHMSLILLLTSDMEDIICPFMDDDEDLFEFFLQCYYLCERADDHDAFLNMFEVYIRQFAAEKTDCLVDVLLEESSVSKLLLRFLKLVFSIPNLKSNRIVFRFMNKLERYCI